MAQRVEEDGFQRQETREQNQELETPVLRERRMTTSTKSDIPFSPTLPKPV
jgi:hypothetical protein